MKHILVILISIAVAACGKPDPAPANSASTGLQDSPLDRQPPKCDLRIRSVESDGSLAPYAFIQPQHVSSIEVVDSSPTSEKPSLAFYLTDTGKKRLLDYTTDNYWGEIAVFCGQQEVIRPTITAPFSGPVFVEISAIGA